MKTPTKHSTLALSLLSVALLGGSTTALAAVPGAALAMFALTTVADEALLELRLRGSDGATAVDLKIDGEWTAGDGDIVDVIAADSPISAVTSQFQVASGHEQRVRFKNHGSPTWGPWSGWTTSRIAHTTAVPGAGQLHADEFEASVRPVHGTPTIAVHGYVKIKKLNTGG